MVDGGVRRAESKMACDLGERRRIALGNRILDELENLRLALGKLFHDGPERKRSRYCNYIQYTASGKTLTLLPLPAAAWPHLCFSVGYILKTGWRIVVSGKGYLKFLQLLQLGHR